MLCACDSKELNDKASSKAVSVTVKKTDWNTIQQQRQHQLEEYLTQEVLSQNLSN
jgi:hypothetical protein